MPTFERALHVALTVRDMRVSADWYERVLGLHTHLEFVEDGRSWGSPCAMRTTPLT